MINAIIFDMDDVIVSSKDFDYPAWKKVFRDGGKELSIETYKSFLGMKSTEIVKKFIPSVKKSDLQKTADKKEFYYLELMGKKGARSTPGFSEFLDEIRGEYKTAIATAGNTAKVGAVLRELGLTTYFMAIVTSDEIRKGKPDPEAFLKAARKLHVRPEQCVVIEDSPLGVKAAKAGGMKCIAITTTHKRSELKEADVIVDSFHEVSPETLQRL